MFLQQVEIVALDGQEAAFEAAQCEVRQRVAGRRSTPSSPSR
jgi:hypothetical protein